jgi:hypothetical protein
MKLLNSTPINLIMGIVRKAGTAQPALLLKKVHHDCIEKSMSNMASVKTCGSRIASATGQVTSAS